MLTLALHLKGPLTTCVCRNVWTLLGLGVDPPPPDWPTSAEWNSQVGQSGAANVSGGRLRRDEFERLGSRAVAGVDLQLHAVCDGGAGDVQAETAALAHKLVVTIAQRHRLPFLV